MGKDKVIICTYSSSGNVIRFVEKVLSFQDAKRIYYDSIQILSDSDLEGLVVMDWPNLPSLNQAQLVRPYAQDLKM